MSVTSLTRNHNVNGTNYTFVFSDPSSGLINIELLTTNHEIHRSTNIQTRMDQGVASFNISNADLNILDPSYNTHHSGSDISLNIIIELLATNNDPTASAELYNDIVTVEPAYSEPKAPVLAHFQDNDEYALLNVFVGSSEDIDHFQVYYKSDEPDSLYKKLTYTLPTDTTNRYTYNIITEDLTNNIRAIQDSGSNDKKYILKLPNLTNGHQYEAYVKAYNQYGQSVQSHTIELTPLNIPAAPVIAKVETIMIGGLLSTTSVKLTVTWGDHDAASYISINSNRTPLPDDANSNARLRIGTVAAIESVSGQYNIDSNNTNLPYLREITLTNGQLKTAASLTGPPEGLTITDISVNLVDWFGREIAITTGDLLLAQIVADSNQYDSSGNLALTGDRDMGLVSEQPTRAYLQVDAVLSEILVDVNLANGNQTFYFNGQYDASNSTGVNLKVWNDLSNNLVNNIIDEPVYLSGVTMDEQFIEQTYIQIVTGNYITARLSVPDRNGTLDGGSVIVYTYTKSFETSKFKTPTDKSAFEFTGNLGHADAKLHTVLTNVNIDEANKFDSDTIPSNVTWELFDNALLTLPYKATGNYSEVNINADISIVGLVGFDVTASYYLKVTKSCALASTIVDRYDEHKKSAVLFSTSDTVVSLEKGPIYWMQKPVLSAIKVNVDLVSGDQTFYFNGTIASLNATGATLTVSNGGNPIRIIDASSVTLSFGANIQEKFEIVPYGTIVNTHNIIAILTQDDRNNTVDVNSQVFKYASDPVTFETYRFKAPVAPSATFAKNLVGNDRTLRATLTNANDNYGYDITTLTAEIFDVSANTLLSDCSGAFDISYNATNQAVSQTKNLFRTADFTVDSSYNLAVTKSYSLNATGVYARYSGAERHDPKILLQTGSVAMAPYAGPVYYMGNPEITDIDITVPNRVKITAQTHGTTLTTEKAFTLVMVAKDGLAGYATGDNLDNMGTEALTNGSSFNATSPANGNAVVDYTFTTTATITTGASCIGIVDVNDGHSAISLKNFPTSALDASYNNKNN
jgi:hypothetical protein